MTECEIFIVVESCASYADRRKACRATWCRHVKAPIKYFFFIGNNDPLGCTSIKEDEPDTVILPCKDDYMSLPKKTFSCFKYALENYDFKYLFKCDDDTFVVPERLLHLSEPKDIVSNSWLNQLSGGAGYFLSRDCVQRVVNECQIKMPAVWAEDLMVQEILTERFHMEIRMTPEFHWGTDGAWPDPDNARITIHYADYVIMEACEHLLYGSNLATCKVMVDGKKDIKNCCFYKSDVTGRVMYVVNSTKYRGVCSLDHAGALILEYDEVIKEKADNGETKKRKEHHLIRLVPTGDGYWEDDRYGPLGIVTPLAPEVFLQNDLPAKQESDIVTA